MKKLTAEDLRNIKPGEQVYKHNGDSFNGLHFVGIMQPNNPDYLIFCRGEHLEHLYINPKDGSFHYDWYSGEFDSEFVGQLLIDKLNKKIELVKRIYIDSKDEEA